MDRLLDDFGFSSRMVENNDFVAPVEEIEEIEPIDPIETHETEENKEEIDEDGLAEVAPEKTTKRKQTGSRTLLKPETLLGKNGILELKKTFEGIKFKGRGHELEDLNTVMSKLEYWAHRLSPKMPFDEVLEKLETFGGKRVIQTAMTKLRQGETVFNENQGEHGEDAAQIAVQDEFPVDSMDPFDRYVARPMESQQPSSLTEEQRQRIEENKRKAMERKKAAESQAIDAPIVDKMEYDLDAIIYSMGPEFETATQTKNPPNPPRKPIRYADGDDFVEEESMTEEEEQWLHAMAP